MRLILSCYLPESFSSLVSASANWAILFITFKAEMLYLEKVDDISLKFVLPLI